MAGNCAREGEKSVSQVEVKKYVQEEYCQSSEWVNVSSIADQLWRYLNTESVLRRIDSANQPNKSSAEVQETILEFARRLGFESNKEGLFSEEELALRPDYYLELDGDGIIIEVERGKTTINNMDLLDFWKYHLCSQANFLFLLVPRRLRQNPQMTPRPEFETVDRRAVSTSTTAKLCR